VAFLAKTAVEKPNLAIGFLAFFSFICAAALRAGWKATFSPMLQLLATILNVQISIPHITTLRPFGFLADAFRSVDTHVYNWLGHLKDASGHAFVQLCLWVAYQVTMFAVGLAAITYELLLWAKRSAIKTQPVYITKIVKVATKPLAQRAAKGAVAHDSRVPALEREVTALRGELAKVREQVAAESAVTMPIPYPVPLPRRQPLPVPIPKTTGKTIPKLSDLQHAWEWTKARLGKLGKLGTIAGLIGLTSAVLGRLGLGWLRCSRVGKAGKQVCGMDSGLLDSLLADTLLIVGTVSLVEFARGMQDVTREVVGPIRTFWRVT